MRAPVPIGHASDSFSHCSSRQPEQGCSVWRAHFPTTLLVTPTLPVLMQPSGLPSGPPTAAKAEALLLHHVPGRQSRCARKRRTSNGSLKLVTVRFNCRQITLPLSKHSLAQTLTSNAMKDLQGIGLETHISQCVTGVLE